jgi:hypothetical protein
VYPSTFPQDQRVDLNLVALLGLALPEDGAGDGNRTQTVDPSELIKHGIS